MFKSVVKGIPKSIIRQIYDELYNLRIDCVIDSDSPRHDTFAITTKRKYKSQVCLLIAKYI